MKHIALAITVGVAGLVGLVAANAAAEEPNACEAALYAKRPNLKSMKKIMLANAKKLPRGIARTDAGVRLDPDLWTLADDGSGVVEFAAKGKKKKKKKKKGKKKGKPTASTPKYMTCLCGGSDSGGCMAFTNMETGDVHCEDTGCSAGCRIGIFGDAADLQTVGFETF